MSFVLDTDTCSAYLRGHRGVFSRFVQHSGGLYVSTVSVGELHVWARRASASPRRQHVLGLLLQEVRSLPVDDDVALLFGQTRARLLDQGVTVPVNDLLIAATALLHDFTVVTHNVRHFELVPNLRIQDWLTP
jgi:tRNA(fMet)-specific endonuclease VapC